MIPRSIVHLLSGGLDSVTLLHDLVNGGELVHCLIVNYRQRHAQEILWAKTHARKLGLNFTVAEMPVLGGMSDSDPVVPFRNALFLGLAVNLAVRLKASTVTIGCNATDAANFPDCRVGFLEKFGTAVEAAGYDVEICAPFLDWPKSRIAALAQHYGIKTSDVWTCYRGGAAPCGECLACRSLKDAFDACQSVG